MRLRTGAGRAVAVGLAAALSVGSARGWAAPPASPDATQTAPGDAAELRRRGNDAMAAFKPGEALDAYSQAYELTHDPALLYNMARALEALEDYPAALARYEDFARLAPPDLRARVPKLDELVAGLHARVARLSVTCNVPGARVMVRERAVGETVARGEALVVSLGAGKAVIEVSADGYNSFQRAIVLPGGGSVGVDVQLVPKAVAGLLVVASEPADGTVFVDGRELGNAPVEASVGAGTHQVVVRLPGYLDKSTSVVVGVGERRVVTINMAQTTPITKKWWFWTGLGTVVATGVVVTYAAMTERGADKGTIPPSQGKP
jgi:hypothetical protein